MSFGFAAPSNQNYSQVLLVKCKKTAGRTAVLETAPKRIFFDAYKFRIALHLGKCFGANWTKYYTRLRRSCQSVMACVF